MRLKRKHVLALSLGLSLIFLAALMLYPWTEAVAPALRLRVFDEAGNPAAGVVVKQEWEYLAVGSQLHSAYARTDEGGYVEFPRRTEGISMLQKGLSHLRELTNIMHGYGMGPNAEVWAYGEDSTVWALASCGVRNPVPQELRLKRTNITMFP